MKVLIPCIRLLAAAALIILLPSLAAAGVLSAWWMLVALPPLVLTSCGMQNLWGGRHVVACTLSNALMLAMVHAAAYAGLALAARL